MKAPAGCFAQAALPCCQEWAGDGCLNGVVSFGCLAPGLSDRCVGQFKAKPLRGTTRVLISSTKWQRGSDRRSPNWKPAGPASAPESWDSALARGSVWCPCGQSRSGPTRARHCCPWRDAIAKPGIPGERSVTNGEACRCHLIGDQCRHDMRFPELCQHTRWDHRGKLRDQGNRLCKMRKSRTVMIVASIPAARVTEPSGRSPGAWW